MNFADSIPENSAELQPTYIRGLYVAMRSFWHETCTLWQEVRSEPIEAIKVVLTIAIGPVALGLVVLYVILAAINGVHDGWLQLVALVPDILLGLTFLPLALFALSMIEFTVSYFNKTNVHQRKIIDAGKNIDQITRVTKQRMNEAAGQNWRNILDK